jgi:hypothetical protein
MPPSDDGVRLYVRPPRNNYPFPQEKVIPDPGALTWTGRVKIGGAAEFVVFAAVVGREGRRQQRQYIRLAEATGQWPPVEQTDDTVECDRVIVKGISA